MTHLDGRLARSQRTRHAIVDSLIGLLEDGVVQPTVEEVAARAGVAPRTVFQHYPDREALFVAVSLRRQPTLDALMAPICLEGSLDERLDALVDQRVRIYEWIAPVRRAALLMEPFSEAIHAALEGLRAVKRSEAVRVFGAEITAVSEERRPALEAGIASAASWSAWDALRTQQRLDVESSRAAVRGVLAGLLCT